MTPDRRASPRPTTAPRARRRGPRALARAPADGQNPVYVACETLKFDARFDATSWPGARTAGLFDVTPGRLVTTVVTERGTYAPAIIRTMLAQTTASKSASRKG